MIKTRYSCDTPFYRMQYRNFMYFASNIPFYRAAVITKLKFLAFLLNSELYPKDANLYFKHQILPTTDVAYLIESLYEELISCNFAENYKQTLNKRL